MQIIQSEINKLRPFIQIIENYDSTDRTIYLDAMEFSIYRNWKNIFYFHIIESNAIVISGYFSKTSFKMYGYSSSSEKHGFELEYDYLKLVLSSEENKFQYSINDGIDYNDQIFEFILDIGTNIKYDEVTKE